MKDIMYICEHCGHILEEIDLKEEELYDPYHEFSSESEEESEEESYWHCGYLNQCRVKN